VILPDVNILVYAFHADSAEHETYSRWLTKAAHGPEELLLPDAVLIGCLRIVTDSRIFSAPAPATAAITFLDALRSRRHARELDGHASLWSVMGDLVKGDRQVAGRLVPDAYLAAAALSHNARIATRDRGFGRFPGLSFFDPAG
jgi:toxin-antitoxin system PIN domain toxin